MNTIRTPSSWRAVLLTISLATVGLARPGIAQTGVPRPDHVVMVIDENKSFSQIADAAGAPYINSLAQQGALFLASFAIGHPSQPNYVALFSGSTHGINDDQCRPQIVGPNLGSELFEAGLTFAGYSESMPGAGFRGCSAGSYQRKHNPWVNFTNVPASANLPFTEFPSNFHDLPTLAIVVPNQNDDMHDGSVAQGDRWLQDHLDAYIRWAMTHRSLFILTWDEGMNGTDNRIVTLMVGEMVRPGRYAERIDHYTVLRTLLEMDGLAPIALTTNRDPITSSWMPGTAVSPVSVALTSPVAGAAYSGPATISLVAKAASSNGAIVKVEFYEREHFLGKVSSAPFSLTVSNVLPGDYWFVAKATDALGQRRTAVSVPVHVFHPLPPVPGQYLGLIYNTNEVAPETSGSATLNLDGRGKFTAQARLGKKTYRLAGAFDRLGYAQVQTKIPMPLSGPAGASNFLQATLALDLTHGTDRIEGTLNAWSVDGTGAVVGSNQVAWLFADRATFSASLHPTSLAGRYTVILPGNTNGGLAPGGDGHGSVIVSPGGQIRMSGTLADGTAVSVGAGLSKDGRWPFYVPLQGGLALLLGWIQFVDQPGTIELNGCAEWIKPPSAPARTKYYPDGFTIVTCVQGSSFTGATNRNGRILSWTNGVVVWEGGNLNSPLTNSLRLEAKGAASSADPHLLTFRISERTGLWQGKVVDPSSGIPFNLRGAVWQSHDVGSGFFLGTNRSGQVRLGAE